MYQYPIRMHDRGNRDCVAYVHKCILIVTNTRWNLTGEGTILYPNTGMLLRTSPFRLVCCLLCEPSSSCQNIIANRNISSAYFDLTLALDYNVIEGFSLYTNATQSLWLRSVYNMYIRTYSVHYYRRWVLGTYKACCTMHHIKPST